MPDPKRVLWYLRKVPLLADLGPDAIARMAERVELREARRRDVVYLPGDPGDRVFFINVGRGMTTRLDDLNAALRGGIIAGAGLDVYEIEPLPREHPLWTAPNILLTPHVAAAGPDLEPARQALIVENARRFSVGEPLVNVVDKSEWY